jgi:thiol-disulfide isomerase/thioredoxin
MKHPRPFNWLPLFAAAMVGSFGVGRVSAAGADGGSEPVNSITAPPSPRDARGLGIGRYVADAGGDDLSGKRTSWRSGRGEKLTVIALTSITCPLCKKFAPSLARIESAYAKKGVNFVYVNVSGEDSMEDMRAQVKDLGFRGLYLRDADQAIITLLNAKTTTEVYVVDSGNTLKYRGAVSDQYGIGFSHDAPRQRYLENALDALLAGNPPTINATSSPGCALEIEPKVQKLIQPEITYTRDIARIVQNNCIECHRAGGVGPFSLETFDSVSKRASMIRTVTQEGIMPPWFAAPHVSNDGKHPESQWANDRSLSAAEKEAIITWIAAGKPKGDDKDLPLPRTFSSSEWTIGTPDAVFQLGEPIEIKADGTMPYKNVVVPVNLTEDKWVRAMQIIPTDKSVVHHVLVFVLPEAVVNDPELRRRVSFDESRGYWGAYVPGNDSVIFPDGMAKRLPKQSVLMFQIHYTPNGKATTDQMKLGVVYSTQPPKHAVHTAAIVNRKIAIPAGASNHPETASLSVPADAKVLAFLPHMHVRGKAFRYEFQRAGETQTKTLLDIPNYDFNWQLRYSLREPLDAPAGSTFTGTAWFDNSADNPANPDPTKLVRWGSQTYDEMMLGYIEYYLVNEDPNNPEEPNRNIRGTRDRESRRGLSFESLLAQFDGNKDGKIEKSEVPKVHHDQFDRLDKSKDGVLTGEDF